jgi:hypothetical protein
MKHKVVNVKLTIVPFLILGLAWSLSASAHSVNLGNSTFEIDTDADGADLVVDTPADHIDWANVNESRKPDTPSGSDDDSFGQGSKEDSAVPSVVSGSIPPNKSDLKTFGFYLEKDTQDRYLHLFWHRVQDPSGTTNMDFEFNQGSEGVSSNGVTPVRMPGDVLIQYDLANGGTVPELFLSTWIDGTEDPPQSCESSNKFPCWSTKENLTGGGKATGSINTAFIPASESDGLSDVGIDPRTFGEATIDFNALAASRGGGCTSFGSAYLKSRSSDSFSSALKDFIAPIEQGIDNCATLKIVKQDDSGDGVKLNGATFEVWLDASPDDNFTCETEPCDCSVDTCDIPLGPNDAVDGIDNGAGGRTYNYTCTTSSPTPGECVFTNVLAGNYWIEETAAPANHDLADPPFQLATVTAGGEDVVKVFTNARKPATVTVTKRDDNSVLMDGVGFTLFEDESPVGSYESGTDTTSVNSCTTGAVSTGVCNITGVYPGDYCLVETTAPSGDYGSASPQCFSVLLNASISKAFVNPRLKGAIKITKTRGHAATTADPDPHAGVKFTVTGGGLASGIDVTTDANGEACVDNLIFSSHVGDYSVTETLPDNYSADGSLTQSVSVTNVATCSTGTPNTVAFSNTPLTKFTITVDSLEPGGTSTTISCNDGASDKTIPATDPDDGDGTYTTPNLLPGAYTCTLTITTTPAAPSP